MFSAAAATSCSAWRWSNMLVAPPFTKVWVSFSDSLRAANVRREISNCRSSARSWKYEQ